MSAFTWDFSVASRGGGELMGEGSTTVPGELAGAASQGGLASPLISV